MLSCGDTRRGKRLWQLRLKGPISATPVAAEGRMLVVGEQGLAQVVDLRPEEGEIVAERDFGETLLSTPAIARGGIFLRSDHTVWRIGAGLDPATESAE